MAALGKYFKCLLCLHFSEGCQIVYVKVNESTNNAKVRKLLFSFIQFFA